MPTPTYTPLANLTLESSAASVTFSSISQAYRDLVVIVEASGSGTLVFRFNADSGANYNLVYMYGDGTTASSANTSGSTSSAITAGGFNSGVKHFVKIDVMDYSATDKHKTAISANRRALDQVQSTAHRWTSTSAISSVAISATSIAAGSTFALYGIVA